MRWQATRLRPGDMVRVRRGMLWHYGVYVSDGEVIQFGMPPGLEPGAAADDIRVCATDIQTFSCGGFAEAAQLSPAERLKRISRKKSIALARQRIGEAGYDIIHNNCEHFAYECVMGTKWSEQEEQARRLWRSRRLAEVYLMHIPYEAGIDAFDNARLNRELKRIREPKERMGYYCALRLMLHGLKDTYGYDEKQLVFKKGHDGKLSCNKACVSVAYTGGAAAAAVSNSPIAIGFEAEPRAMAQDEHVYRIKGFEKTPVSVRSKDALLAHFHLWDGGSDKLLMKEELPAWH